MGFFDHPDTPYSKLTYLNNLPVYTANAGVDSLLDQAREFSDSDNYYFQGVPFPGAADIVIPARTTFGGVITVPALCYVTSITGDCFKTSDPTAATNGFQFRIYDKGARLDSIINAQYVRNTMVAPAMRRAAGALFNSRPIGPGMLQSPFVVLQPGSLQMEVTNLSTFDCSIQLMLALAVPINPMSASEMIVISQTPKVNFG